MDIHLAHWMEKLNAAKRDTPINLLAIPGSHDCMSYGISKSSNISPDAESWVKNLAKYFGPLVKFITQRWSVTQRESIINQLKLGIRYFDFRIATKTDDPNFYFVHGLYGPNIDTALNNFVEFLDEHPKEVVIIDFQHFYSFSTTDHYRLINLLKSKFEDKMCPRPNDISSVTLNWMFSKKYQIIVIYRNQRSRLRSFLWSSDMWPTPWPNTMDKTKLIDFLNMRLAQRPRNTGFVSQGVLTPQRSTVFKHAFSGVKKKCATPAYKVLIPWIQHVQQPLNVVIGDFIEMDNAKFPLSVISANYI